MKPGNYNITRLHLPLFEIEHHTHLCYMHRRHM